MTVFDAQDSWDTTAEAKGRPTIADHLARLARTRTQLEQQETAP